MSNEVEIGAPPQRPVDLSGAAVLAPGSSSTRNTIQASDGATVPLTVRAGAAAGSQTANLSEFRTSDGASVLTAVEAAGAVRTNVAAGAYMHRNMLTATDTVAAHRVLGDGRHELGVGGSTAPDLGFWRDSAGSLTVQGLAGAAGTRLAVKSTASQSGNLTEWQDSSAVAKAWVDGTGGLFSLNQVQVQNTLSSPTLSTQISNNGIVFSRAGGGSFIRAGGSGGNLALSTRNTANNADVNRIVVQGGDTGQIQFMASALTRIDATGRLNVGGGTPSTSYGLSTQGWGGMKVLALTNPVAPTVTVTGATGATTYTYWIVARDAAGNKTAASPATTVANGNATLTASNFNAVAWTAVSLATSYDVLRTTAGGALSTAVSVATGVTVTSFNDQGAGTNAYTRTRNATGDLTLDGRITYSYGPAEFNVRDYGAKGDAVADDTQAIQDAAADAIANHGTLVFPYTTAGYNVSSTILLQGAGSQFIMHIRGEGDVALINWTGGSNTSVFRSLGWKTSNIINLKARPATSAAVSNVVFLDVDCDSSHTSTGVLYFRASGASTNNSHTGCSGLTAFRFGHNSNGYDVSVIQLAHCQANWDTTLTGGRTRFSDQAAFNGHVGFRFEGANTLNNTINGGGFGGCAIGVTNVGAGGASAPGQNGSNSIYVHDVSASYNDLDFQYGTAGRYSISGRFEVGRQFLSVPLGSGSANSAQIEVHATIASYKGPTLFDLQGATHLEFTGNIYNVDVSGQSYSGFDYSASMVTFSCDATKSGSINFHDFSANAADPFWTSSQGLLYATVTGSTRTTVSGAAVTNNGRFAERRPGRGARRAVTASTTATADDGWLGVTDTTAARTVTLPTASAALEGYEVTVKDETGAAATNNITISPQGTDKIEGAASKVLNTNWAGVRLRCTGATGNAAWVTAP